jgi:CheY-like chemotaxis protein/two-component sensor histidine kinase
MFKKNSEISSSSGKLAFPNTLRQQVSLERSAFAAKFSTEFEQRVSALEETLDLTAKLICTKTSEMTWDVYLTHIRGSKVPYLLGHSFDDAERVSLEHLLSSERRVKHEEYITSILNEGEQSPYWSYLFENMMRHPVNITNPFNNTDRLVQIIMKLDECIVDVEKKPQEYHFNVTFIDLSLENMVANKAGGITHDLRGLLTATKNTAGETLKQFTREQFMHLSKEELSILYDKLTQETIDVHAVINESMSLCKPSRADFTTNACMHDSITSQEMSDAFALPEDKIPTFLRLSKSNYSTTKSEHCELIFTGHPNIALEIKTIQQLERFLLNLIKNAIEAAATKIEITFAEENENFVCEVVDNGNGMPSEIASTFFTRKMPQKRGEHQTLAVENNRGEGTLIAYQAWTSCGGSAEVNAPRNGEQGTRFVLSIPALSRVSMFPKHFPVWNTHQTSILNLIKKYTHHLLLVVDDSFMQIKSIMNRLKKFLSTENEPSLYSIFNIEKKSWESGAIALDVYNEWYVITASNGDIAHAIYKEINNIDALITDQQMPGHLQGIDLIKKIRQYEKITQRNINIALNTADSFEDMDTKTQDTIVELNVRLLLKGNNDNLMDFVSSIRPATITKPLNIPFCH